MFHMRITLSTGTLEAQFLNVSACFTAAEMVLSGAQVAQPWSMEVRNDMTGAQVAGSGRSLRGAANTIGSLLDGLDNQHGPVRSIGEGIDVLVPVRLAMHNGNLTDAEDWVRGIMNRALTDNGNELGEDPAPSFSFNGDTVTVGEAREEL